MTPRVGDALGRAAQVVDGRSSVAAAARAMMVAGVDVLVVIGEHGLRGIVLAEDLNAARPSASSTLTAQGAGIELDRVPITAIARPARAVTPRTPLAEAARLLRDGDVRALPVVQGGVVVGILTAVDVVDWTLHHARR